MGSRLTRTATELHRGTSGDVGEAAGTAVKLHVLKDLGRAVEEPSGRAFE